MHTNQLFNNLNIFAYNINVYIHMNPPLTVINTLSKLNQPQKYIILFLYKSTKQLKIIRGNSDQKKKSFGDYQTLDNVILKYAHFKDFKY